MFFDCKFGVVVGCIRTVKPGETFDPASKCTHSVAIDGMSAGSVRSLQSIQMPAGEAATYHI